MTMLCIASAATLNLPQTTPGLAKRVVGGKDASDGEFPFAVYISNPESTQNTACAGAILTDQIIVTAAYCVYDTNTGKAVDPSKVSVGYGKSNKVKQPAVKVKQIIISDTYNATSGVDDIALLQVNLTNQISDAVNRIPVYVGDIKKDNSLIFMGWGSTDKIGVATADTLNFANVTVGDDFTCKASSLYQNSNGRAICTHNLLTPNVAPCLGDYGGPLVIYDQNIPKLVGVFSTFATSDGKPQYYCTSNNTLAYYTHINYYMSFLESKTKLPVNAFTGNEPLPLANGTQSANGKSNSGMSKGAIAGVSVAAAAVLILVCILVYVVRSNMKKKLEARHEQRIYELGLQQLADEL
ncbi:hypothetical protein GGH16_005346, partial [Coemansia sp. RSA 560]